MGKRTVDHETNFETPTNKKRKIDNDITISPITPTTDLSFVLTTETVDGVVLTDLCGKKWRCGKPIGKGSFGEIFLASDDILKPVTGDNAEYVVKIEPHKSGPLFVEIHCLLKAGKATDEKPLPLGMPNYIASGGHYFGDVRYRFLILPRFDCDLHSLIKNRRVDTKNILIIADQLLDILEHIHDNGYAHSDIKAENIMISKCKYKRISDTTEINNITNGQSGRKRNELTNAGRRSRRKIISTSSSDNSDLGSVKSESGHSDDDSDIYQEEDDEETTDEEEEEVDDDDEEHDGESNATADETSDSDASSEMVVRRRKPQQRKTLKPTSSIRSDRKIAIAAAYEEALLSHNLRRSIKKVNYCDMDSDGDEPKPRYEEDNDWEADSKVPKRLSLPEICQTDELERPRKRINRIIETDSEESSNEASKEPEDDSKWVIEDRVHLIDFGLALKFVDSTGQHRPFVMDQRRAHDGTLEFTSRDAHMGAHSRRSDLECLAYNLIYWQEGFLPWKNEKLMTQPEQVHRMKEYFMTDIKQLYKKIYGVTIPTFINEFMMHVTNLAYHDRPNYKMCKEIFRNEFLKLGLKTTDMVLNVTELKNKPVCQPETAELENNIVGQKLMDVTKMMKLGMILPFCESPTSKNRISPKNLRSKTSKNPKKRRKDFSWTEILSTDPDQIARQRAEKEFERDQTLDQTPVSHRYSGNPTYAILEVENNKTKNKIDIKELDTQKNENVIKGYTKPMMDVWRKRQLMLMKQFQVNGKGKKKQTSTSSASASEKSYSFSSEDVTEPGDQNQIDGIASTRDDQTSPSTKMHRRKPGLRRVIRPTKKLLENQNGSVKQRRKNTVTANSNNIKYPRQTTDEGYSGTDDSSNCSSNVASSAVSHSSLTSGQVGQNNGKYNGSCGIASSISEEDDSRDTNDEFSPITTRRGRARKTTMLRALLISDEESRDTTDYSPVKRKRKSKSGKGGRRRNDQKSRKGIGRKLSSPTIRAFSRG